MPGLGVARVLRTAEADAGIEGMNGKKVGESTVRVTKSKRNGAYQKIPKENNSENG